MSRLKSSGKNILIKVKSTKDVTFVKEPQTNHVTQLMFYMEATGVHNGIILYIDKNNLSNKIFEVEFDPKKAAATFLTGSVPCMSI